jgi:hypothetical protein
MRRNRTRSPPRTSPTLSHIFYKCIVPLRGAQKPVTAACGQRPCLFSRMRAMHNSGLLRAWTPGNIHAIVVIRETPKLPSRS